MDMLEFGNGGMSTTQYQTHFSFWAALKSPLILGNDVSTMTEEDFKIISNKEVIAINQDELGESVYLIKRTFRNYFIADTDIWFGKLSGGRYVALLFNRNPTLSQPISLIFKDLLPPTSDIEITSATIRDIWAAQDLGPHSSTFTCTVPPHATKILLFTSVLLKQITPPIADEL